MIPSQSFHRLSIALSVGALLLTPLPSLAAPPTVSAVYPATANVNTPVSLSASVSAASGVQSCKLYVDLAEIGPMMVMGNTASLSYTFTSGGSHIAFVFCKDNDGVGNSGANTALWVEGTIAPSTPFYGGGSQTPAPIEAPVVAPTVPSTPPPATGSLIKLACAADAIVNDPCRAVYYRSVDGKRHAFPTSKVYFTWYQNFDSVQTVSPTEMSNSLLGKNVNYRPGVKMVKFETVNRVYAIAPGGVLRWVTSEAVAHDLYGENWNMMIDDISDTLYGYQVFGPDIQTSSDYSVATVLSASTSIENSF